MFVSAFLRVGSSGDHGSAWVLTRAVGPAKARELLFLGERIDAEEAHRVGLVSAVVDDDALRDHVDAIRGDARGRCRPTRRRLMKQNLDDALTLPLGAYLDAETARFAECSGSPEAVRGRQGLPRTELSNRMGVRLTEDEAWAELAAAHTGILTTLRRDGRPVPLPVWFVALDRTIYVRTPGARTRSSTCATIRGRRSSSSGVSAGPSSAR